MDMKKEKQPSIKMTAKGFKYDSKFHHVVISKNEINCCAESCSLMQ